MEYWCQFQAFHIPFHWTVDLHQMVLKPEKIFEMYGGKPKYLTLLMQSDFLPLSPHEKAKTLQGTISNVI
jgi:hypothetical protein